MNNTNNDTGSNSANGMTYGKAGIDISYTDSIKRDMAEYVSSRNPRVLNGLGPFASLYDIRFDEIKNPVLVLKTEEPGSKQKLAINHGYTESICHDMINHLVNDIIVMGAKPLAVLDTIVCGKAEGETISALVKGISEACANNDCVLVGGETSIQPGVLEAGGYVLTASVAGIIDREKIIDGSRIAPGDKVLAVASNGLHTNGYTLVRLMMENNPGLRDERIDENGGTGGGSLEGGSGSDGCAGVGGITFFEAIMKPHTPYYLAVRDLFDSGAIHGMAHITGGGIEGNLSRVMPSGTIAEIDLEKIMIPRIFKRIREVGSVDNAEMLKTFNCGVGLIIVAAPNAADEIARKVSERIACYEIGEICSCPDTCDGGKTARTIKFLNNPKW